MSKKSFYVTTPIYYVNDTPHIGHAYTSVAADVLARFHRLEGEDVFFLTGTDEHGQKIQRSAEKKGVDPQAFTNTISHHFRELSTLLNLTETQFIRTTEPRHKRAAQALWQRLQEKGHIYQSTYAGWYAIRDEAFYNEKELVDGKAPTGAEVEWVEEPSYFFDLSKWQEPLLKFYEENPDFIGPASRRNEVISFVKSGLRDLSISRSSFTWGVPVPDNPDHVMYVWLDALTNYLTALGFPDEGASDYQTHWPQVVHLVGKDILRFHAVYWPAFLMAAGLEPPARLFAHGWWTNEGQKISKSLGNTIAPQELVEHYGVDQVRYFMMREIPFGGDGDFSKAAIIQRTNADLANDLGNLVQRVLSFIHKYCGAALPAPEVLTEEDKSLLDFISDILPRARAAIKEQALHKYCEIVWQGVTHANRYVDTTEPWTLRKKDPERMKTVLYVLANVIHHLALFVSPVTPGAAEKIFDQLNLPQDKRVFAALDEPLVPGTSLPKPQGVFPRIAVEIDEVGKVLELE